MLRRFEARRAKIDARLQSSKLLDVGSGDFIRPGEVFRIDQHPEESKRHGKNGNEIAKSTPAGLNCIKRLLVFVHDNKPLIFHAGSLAGAEHEEEHIDRKQCKITNAVNAENTFVECEVLRHFNKCRKNKNNVNGGDNREIHGSGGQARNDQISLVLRKRKRRGLLRFFEIEVGLVFLDGDDRPVFSFHSLLRDQRM